MAPARGAAASSGQAARSEVPAERGLGPGVWRRSGKPAALHGPAAPQTGARPQPPPLAADRARYGLPLPAQPRRFRTRLTLSRDGGQLVAQSADHHVDGATLDRVL